MAETTETLMTRLRSAVGQIKTEEQAREAAARIRAFIADHETDGGLPPRPVFDHTATDLFVPLVDSAGREWDRVVFEGGEVCAAEDMTGNVTVWDAAALFEAVFGAADRHG